MPYGVLTTVTLVGTLDACLGGCESMIDYFRELDMCLMGVQPFEK